MLDLKKEEPKPRLHLGEDATVVLQLLKGKLEKYNGVLVHPKAWRDQWVVSIPHDNKELVVNDCNLDVNLQRSYAKRRESVTDGCQPSLINGRNRSSAKMMLKSIGSQLRAYITVKAKKVGSKAKAIAQMHQHFDMDGSGLLDRAELFQAFAIMHIKVTKEEFDLLFAVFDSNGDGGVSMDELIQVINDVPSNTPKKETRLAHCAPLSAHAIKKKKFAIQVARAGRKERRRRMKEKTLMLPELPDVKRAKRRRRQQQMRLRRRQNCVAPAAKSNNRLGSAASQHRLGSAVSQMSTYVADDREFDVKLPAI